MQPTKGRVVIYHDAFCGKDFTAHIAEVNVEDSTVDLIVFDTTQNPPITLRRNSPKGTKPGSWRWPAIVK